MGSKTISVVKDISVHRMLRLDATDNLLINSFESLWKCHAMLQARINRSSDKHDVRIHLRPTLFETDLGNYVEYAEDDGLKLMLWSDDDTPSGIKASANVSLVNIPMTPGACREGFLVITTSTWGRVLSAWLDDDGNLEGVLVTNPRTVAAIAAHLDSILQAAAV
jgi:hypothetical protein